MGPLKSEKVLASIQSFLLFLNLAKQSKTLSDKEAKKIQERALDLLQALTTSHVTVAQATEQFNALVKQTNERLPAPYPSLDTRSTEDLLRSDIVAFEHFVHQELNAGHLLLNQETELFNQAVSIWEDVGIDDTKQSVGRFSQVVHKANALLPKEEHFPLPKPTQY